MGAAGVLFWLPGSGARLSVHVRPGESEEGKLCVRTRREFPGNPADAGEGGRGVGAAVGDTPDDVTESRGAAVAADWNAGQGKAQASVNIQACI